MSRLYNFPCSDKPVGSTAPMRHQHSLEQGHLIFEPFPGISNLQKLVLRGQSEHPDAPFLGTRNPASGQYEFTKYQDAVDQATAIGSALQHLNLLKQGDEVNKSRLQLIGIYAPNRAEWTICDMANALYRNTMVPLYDTLGPESVSYVLGHSEVTTVFCSTASINTLARTPQLHGVQTIISLDSDLSEESVKQLESRGVKIIHFSELLAIGASNKKPYPSEILPDSIFTFSYTSGTTGNPKGAMVTHRNILGAVSNHQGCEFKYLPTDTHMCYLPLPHIFERFLNVTCWLAGCKIAFYGGNVLKLREDICASKATMLAIVPRLLNRFDEAIRGYCQATVQAEIYEKAVSEKLANIEGGVANCIFHKEHDAAIFGKSRQLLGGSLRAIVSGSAPASHKVLNSMKVHLSCSVSEGYGQTEGTGLETIKQFEDVIGGHVGGILPSLELKLQDVPEMDYLSTDKDALGNPTPRGEVCIRGHSVFQGYYRDAEKTLEAIDSEGWLHSGDIGTLLPHGGLKIIDRKKNIFKLSIGEYVSPEKVEILCTHTPGILEAFVHADSTQAYCVAVIVPNPESVKSLAELTLNLPEASFEEHCKNEKVVKAYLDLIIKQGKTDGLLSFEVPKKIFLEPKSLVLHECLTSSFKLQRHKARIVFAGVLKELYSNPL